MATIMDILSSILNPNPGQNRLVAPNANGPNYLTQTGLDQDQLARFHQMSGMGGQAAPATSMPQAQGAPMPQQAPQPDQTQTASVAAPAVVGATASAPPSNGGGLLGRLFGGQSAGENQTIQWLQQQGMDPGTATMMAKSKPILQAYLLKRSQGKQPIEIAGKLVDPDTYKVIADFSEPGNRQTATIDGKLVDTNTGQVIGDYGADDKTRTMTPQEVEAAGLPSGVYQQDKEGKISAVGSVRDQDAGFKNEMDLRKEYTAEPPVKSYQIVRDNFERMRQGASLTTGAGDLAIIFGYMKMLDPTSVVREGEQAAATDVSGVPSRILNLYNSVAAGAKLPPEARSELLGAAEQVYGEAAKNLGDVNTRYGSIATNWKVDPSRIVLMPEQYDPLAPPAETATGLPLPPAPVAPAAPSGPAPDRFAPDIPTDKSGRVAPSADGWRPVAPGVKIRRVN